MARWTTTLARTGAVVAVPVGATLPAVGQTTEQRLKLLEATQHHLLQRDTKKDAVMQRLNTEVRALRAGSRAALAGAEADHGHAH